MFTDNPELIAYRSKYFKIYELVTPELYAGYKNDPDALWILFDSRLVWTIDALRELYGPAIINTWYVPGKTGYTVDNNGFKERGIRSKGTSTGAVLSQHKFGRACDMSFKQVEVPKILTKLNELGMFKDGQWRHNPTVPEHSAFKYVTTIERSLKGNLLTWLHIDVRNRVSSNLAITPLDL